jgi:RNA polymerase sigma factor (sigma-70 family)
MRTAGNEAMAEDAAQAVFLALARKARSLLGHASIAGWLYRAARFAAKDAVKLERRRRRREAEVARMNTGMVVEEKLARWEELAPQLEPALDELPERLRLPILMRFYRRMTHGEIAAALKVSEEAVEKRVARGLDRLGRGLVRRGVTLPAGGMGGAAVAGMLLGHVVRPAPAALAAALGAPVGGAGTSVTILTLLKGVLQMGAMMKYAVAAAVVLVAGVVSMELAASYQAAAATPGMGKAGGAAAGRGVKPAVPPSGGDAAATELGTGLAVQLAPGLAVEIMGVTKDSSQEGGWWRPDGTPLAEAPYGREALPAPMRQMFQLSGQGTPGVPAGVMREFAVRIWQPAGKKPANVSVVLQNTDEGGKVKPEGPQEQPGAALVASSTCATVEVKGEPGLQAIVGTLSGSPATASLVLRAATGAWETRLRAVATSGKYPMQGREAAVNVQEQGGDSTAFTIELPGPYTGNSEPEHVIVRETDGRAETVTNLLTDMRNDGNGIVRTLKFTVKVPAAKIAGIEYQVRPWGDAVEVSQISLEPGKESHPQVQKMPEEAKNTGLRGPGGEVLP